LLRTQKRYLSIAVSCLQDKLSEESLDREAIYCLCHYASSINKVIDLFEGLIKSEEGDAVTVSYAQAIVAKAYMKSFKYYKKLLMYQHHTSVEMH
jgi:hypothetical protein